MPGGAKKYGVGTSGKNGLPGTVQIPPASYPPDDKSIFIGRLAIPQRKVLSYVASFRCSGKLAAPAPGKGLFVSNLYSCALRDGSDASAGTVAMPPPAKPPVASRAPKDQAGGQCGWIEAGIVVRCECTKNRGKAPRCRGIQVLEDKTSSAAIEACSGSLHSSAVGAE